MNKESGLAGMTRWISRHAGLVAGVWLVLMVALGGAWATSHGTFVDTLDLPGAESQAAVDLLKERVPSRAGDQATVVMYSDKTLRDPEVQADVQAMQGIVEGIPGVVGVVPPYAPESGAISADGKTGIMVVQFAQTADAVPEASVDALHEMRDAYDSETMQVELGGVVITAGEEAPPGQSEVIGLISAVVILLIAFGSVLAMGLPLLTALVGLGASVFVIGLLALTTNFSTQTTAFTAMIGIGVGIDYALFIVTRYRERLQHGDSVEDAVVLAANTAGRSVLFAGSIVVVALLGLMTMGIPFVGALGLAAAVVVAMAVAVALTLLPALLSLIGHRIDRWGVFGRDMAAATKPGGRWERVAGSMQRHPWRAVVASLAIMLVLAAPALDMRIGSSDAGNSPTSLTSRRAYDLVTEGFGPGYNGPLTIVVDLASATDPSVVNSLVAEIADTPGVAHVSAPASSQEASNQQSDVAIISVVPETSPQDEATQDLVYTLREDVIAPTLDGTGAEAHVGGPTAAYIDMADRISERLPVFFAVVIGLSAVLLMIVFRSIVIPLQAAIMNLLAIAAAYGVLVAIFQWGWLSSMFGVDRTGPIESFLPMMLFGILFGLSTDYEVFLVSRMHESWLETGDNRRAVNQGSAGTMRVITAAASIMVMVFLSFTLSDVRIVKEFGLGLAVAVFLYATVIRLMLAPAMMGLFGRWNWYMPAWMDRRLPRLSIEGPATEAAPFAPSAD